VQKFKFQNNFSEFTSFLQKVYLDFYKDCEPYRDLQILLFQHQPNVIKKQVFVQTRKVL